MLEQLRQLASERPSYGYRTAVGAAAFGIGALSSCQRSMPSGSTGSSARQAVKQHHRLLQRNTGSPPMQRTKTSQWRLSAAISAIARMVWRSAVTTGERVRVTCSLDCCDRQAIAFAATTAGISGELVRDVMVQTLLERFDEVPQLPRPAEWLSDNGAGYIARDTRSFARNIGLIPDARRTARRRAMAWPSRS